MDRRFANKLYVSVDDNGPYVRVNGVRYNLAATFDVDQGRLVLYPYAESK